jgi:galactose mutarotase-like enzyme
VTNVLSSDYTTIDGLEALWVSTGPLTLALVPELGGKMISLRDARSGREWLWRHPRMPYRPGPAESYVASADTGGWDECFPSVAACAYPDSPWRDAPIADHGELWSQPAALALTNGEGTLAVRTSWRGRALPYAFERTITLTAGSARLRCDYRVESLADAPMHFIWCAHPLLAVEPGMGLELPAGASFNCWAGHPSDLLAQPRGLPFPPPARLAGAPINLSVLPPVASAVALKVWSDPLPAGAGHAAVLAADGALRMRWDVALLPQVAMWMNMGAFGFDGGEPYYNLGLEPCIGAQDSLAQAVTDERLSALLPPRASRAWWLEIELTS